MNHPRFFEYLVWLLEHELVSKYIESDHDDDSNPIEKIGLTPKGIEANHSFVECIDITKI
jgi:hypothetical protein